MIVFRTEKSLRALEQQRRRNAKTKARRDRNRADGRCINENELGTHGVATHGVRCESCAEKHRGSR